MLALKKSSFAFSCWDKEAMEFFILERVLLCLSKFLLQGEKDTEGEVPSATAHLTRPRVLQLMFTPHLAFVAVLTSSEA